MAGSTLIKTDYTVPFYTENWKESSFLDVRIVCADGECRAHKLALIHASQFVGFTLDDQFPGEETTLMLPDVSLAVMELLLDLIYTGASDVPEGLISAVEETMLFLQWIGASRVTKTESQSQQTPAHASGSLDFLSPISFGNNSYHLEGIDKLLSDEEMEEPVKQPSPTVCSLEEPLDVQSSDVDVAETLTSTVVRTRPSKVEVRDVAVQVPEPEVALEELPHSSGTSAIEEKDTRAADDQDTAQRMDVAEEDVNVDIESLEDEADAEMSDEEPLDLSIEKNESVVSANAGDIPEHEHVVDIIEPIATKLQQQDENAPNAASEIGDSKSAKRGRGRPPKGSTSRKKGILSRGVGPKGWFDSSQEISQQNDFQNVRRKRAARKMKDHNDNHQSFETDPTIKLNKVTRLHRKSAVKTETSPGAVVVDSDHHQLPEENLTSPSCRRTRAKSSSANGLMQDWTEAKETVPNVTSIFPVPAITNAKTYNFILDDMKFEYRSGHFQASVSHVSGHPYEGLLLPSEIVSVVSRISRPKVWSYLKRLKLRNNMVVSVLLIKPTESLHSDFNSYFDTLVHKYDLLENRNGEDIDSFGQLGVLAVTKPFKYCYLLPYAKGFALHPAIQTYCQDPIQLPEDAEKCFLAIVIRKKAGLDSNSPNSSSPATPKASNLATPNCKKRVSLSFQNPECLSSGKRPRRGRSCSASQSSQEQETGDLN